MTSRLVSRFVIAVAFLVPVAIGATPTRQTEATLKEMTLSVDPNDAGLVRLRRPSDGGTLEAEGRNVKAIYSATGLTVRMADGDLIVDGKKQDEKFKTLELKFATNGNMISMRVEY